ncbi:MAG: signal peptidase I [Eubacterium sp.]|nr:signal peptidase I [Eubacterium sp.]
MNLSEETQVKELQEDLQEEKQEEKPTLKSELLGYVKLIIIAVILAYIVSHVIIVNASIPSSSMENTIMTGSRVIGNRLAYTFSEPQRGDIIVFKYPVDESELFIKRIIGLPGETVEIRDAKIYIDGSETPLEEDYLPEEWTVGYDGYVFEVPEGCYLVLGDNRNVSQDARYWAEEAYNLGVASTWEEAEDYTYVQDEQVVAKAIFVYYPKFYTL